MTREDDLGFSLVVLFVVLMLVGELGILFLHYAFGMWPQ